MRLATERTIRDRVAGGFVQGSKLMGPMLCIPESINHILWAYCTASKRRKYDHVVPSSDRLGSAFSGFPRQWLGLA